MPEKVLQGLPLRAVRAALFASVAMGMMSAAMASELTGNITVWSWTAPARGLEAAIPGFNKLHPGVTVTVEDVGNPAIWDKITAGMAAGGAGLADVLNVGIDYMGNYVETFPNGLANLSEMGADDLAAQFPSGMWASGSAPDGSVRGIPYEVNTAGFFYRKDLFAEAGVDINSIKTWDDLVKPGVKVVTPNPLSSGSACWNLMAAYGAEIKEGKTPTQALDFVKQLLQHTVALPDSGANATAAFLGGTGNVLIGYENEAISAQAAGADIDYVTPEDTILIENPIAVTKDASDPTLAKEFVDFLYTHAGQKLFASEGYRPVVAADLDKGKFPRPSGLFTIDSLGGWSKVNSEFFDATNGIVTKIEGES